LRTSVPEGKPISKPVEVGEYAFIGAGSIILKGVSIGKYSVIGAGSVVTKNVPDGEIWGGNPAKKIGSFDEYVTLRKEKNENLLYPGNEYAINFIWDKFYNEKNKKV
jgi:acetyltransferase-like isoleucine patch superfamily enzyme